MKRLFVDTSAWFAFFNGADPDNEAVAKILVEWDGRLVTTEYVFDEIVTLLRYRVDHHTARRAGKVLRNGDIATLATVELRDVEEAWNRFCKQADKKYSFTDCTSFAVMDRLGLTKAAAVDPDFRRAGFQVLPSNISP